MKNLFTLIAALLLAVAAAAQTAVPAPAWESAVSFQGSTPSMFWQTSQRMVDAEGNVYLAGSFPRTITLGTITLGSAGEYDLFVAKWSRTLGAFEWAVSAGGPGDDVATSLALVGSRLYVGGIFGESGLSFGGTTLTRPPGELYSHDLFVAQLNLTNTGPQFGWAKRLGGTRNDRMGPLVARGNEVYVAGSFDGTAAEFGPFTLAGAGGEGFVAKLVDEGTDARFAWALALGAEGAESISALALSGSSVYVGGSFGSPTFDFGPYTVSNSSRATDLFVAKLTEPAAGGAPRPEWAVSGGGTGQDFPGSLAVEGRNVYLTGTFEGEAATFGSTVLAAAGRSDLLVAKLTDTGPLGYFEWALAGGGLDYDYASGLAVRAGRLYMAGGFSGGFSGTVTFGATTLRSSSRFGQAYVLKVRDSGPSGAFEWAQQADSDNGGGGASGFALSGQRLYLSGGIIEDVRFAPFELRSPPEAFENFLVTLIDPGLPAALPTATTSALATAAVRLFPNPARTTATVVVPAMRGAATVTLTLLDALGRSVRRHTGISSGTGLRYELDLNGLPAGVYALRVALGSQCTTHRLVVE